MFISDRTCVLFSPAGASGRKDLYVTPGHDVILPCGDASSSGKCQFVTWLYNRDPSYTFTLDIHERDLNSSRTPRLSLDHDCSLVIKHIAAEDAGLYTCRQNGNPDFDRYLSVLTSESHFNENVMIQNVSMCHPQLISCPTPCPCPLFMLCLCEQVRCLSV